jgi:hypothetical protein
MPAEQPSSATLSIAKIGAGGHASLPQTRARQFHRAPPIGRRRHGVPVAVHPEIRQFRANWLKGMTAFNCSADAQFANPSILPPNHLRIR